MPISESVVRKLHLPWGRSKTSQKQKAQDASGVVVKVPATRALPAELWLDVMRHLNPFELSQAKLVCRDFRAFASDTQAWNGRAGASAEISWVAQLTDLRPNKSRTIVGALRAAHTLNVAMMESCYARFCADVRDSLAVNGGTIGTTQVVPDIGYVFQEARIRLLDKADASAKAGQVAAYVQAMTDVDTVGRFTQSGPPSRYAAVQRRGATAAMHASLRKMEGHADYGEYAAMAKEQASAKQWAYKA